MSTPPTLKLAGHVLELEGTREWCCTDDKCGAVFSEYDVELMKAARFEALEEAAAIAEAVISDDVGDVGAEVARDIRALKGGTP